MTTIEELPELPAIGDTELRIKVFAHKSLEGRKADLQMDDQETESNERMAFLGDSILQMCVTEYLYDTYKLHRKGWLTATRANCVCNERLARWAKLYGLPPRLKAHWATKAALQDLESEQASLFEAYVAGVFLDPDGGGLPRVREWLTELTKVTPDADDIAARFKNLKVNEDGTESTSRAQSTSPKPKKLASVPGSLARFNEDAIRYGKKVRFDDEAEGKPNERTWNVKLYIDEKFVAEARSDTKKEAKNLVVRLPEAQEAIKARGESDE